jgi:trypsin
MNLLSWMFNSVVISVILGSALSESTTTFIQDNKAAYIVGGHQTQAFQYPFMVFVTDQKQQCGGTIVGHNLVVTAAHCISSQNNLKYRIIANRHNLETSLRSERAVIFQAKKIIVHPSYNTKSLENDIALIILNNDNPGAISGFDMDKMIKLDTQGQRDRRVAEVIGWGLTQGGGTTSSVLKKADLKIVSNDECSKLLGAFNPSYKICAAPVHQGDSACQGDSGGPLISRNTLIGIVSYGAENCDGPVSVYTRISKYVNWINQHRGKGSTKTSNSTKLQQPHPPQQNWWQQQQSQWNSGWF